MFQEILYRYSLIGKKDTAISLLRDIYTLNVEILPIGKEEIEKMIELATKYKDKNITPRDLIHVGVMITNNISKIIIYR
ncbi:MAG: PIN domain-containing protein [Actinobacteria bacterium]|nr:PIN domain-containing protein [Actinomycetota bacterium]